MDTGQTNFANVRFGSSAAPQNSNTSTAAIGGKADLKNAGNA